MCFRMRQIEPVNILLVTFRDPLNLVLTNLLMPYRGSVGNRVSTSNSVLITAMRALYLPFNVQRLLVIGVTVRVKYYFK